MEFADTRSRDKTVSLEVDVLCNDHDDL